MRIIKEDLECGMVILIVEDNTKLLFEICGNGDLYWSIYDNEKMPESQINIKHLIITKENFALYQVFEKLFTDFENENLFTNNSYYENSDKKVKEKYDLSKQKSLYCSKRKVITWHSDETTYSTSNILKITDQGESYKIDFSTQREKEGHDSDFSSSNYISIRFRNSGSRYAPYNIIFMRMYNSLLSISDTKDFGHQIHMEEYIYSKRKVKIK